MATFVPDPKDTVLDHELNSDQYDLRNDEAREYLQKNEFFKAAILYGECIYLRPDRTTGYTDRALCYLRLNMPLDAENDCTKALQKEPSNVKALYRRGQARKALKKYGDSLSDFDRLLAIDPGCEVARIERDSLIQHLHAQIQQSTTSPTQPSFSSMSAAVSQPSRSIISFGVRQPSLSTWSGGVLQPNLTTVHETVPQTSVPFMCGTSTVTDATKKSTWTCSVCEFENDSHVNVCYFCETTRNDSIPSTELFKQHTRNTPTREQSQTYKSQEERKTKSTGVEEIRDQKTNQKRKLNTETEKTPFERKRSNEKCGTCLACTRSDCGECRFCLDGKKYGGSRLLKQGCEKRRCLYGAVGAAQKKDFAGMKFEWHVRKSAKGLQAPSKEDMCNQSN